MRRLNHHANEAVNQWHGVDGHVVTCRMLRSTLSYKQQAQI
jgi:hypothetical protein